VNLAAWAFALASVLSAPAEESADKPRIPARVDPRVELMCIIFRLAGNPEYNQRNSGSPYADDVKDHFAEFRERYPTLEAFMPEVVSVFDACAGRYDNPTRRPATAPAAP
jgi:hypothetical protein